MSGRRDTNIMNSKPAVLIIAIASILLGIFFIISQGDNRPIERSEAISYFGEFEEYDVSRNYRGVHFKDGSVYEVYPHTESREFQEMMKALQKGTKLYILINPNNDYIVEIKTDTEELLNFDLSQKELDSYDNGYIGIGIFMCFAGVFLVMYVIISSCYYKKEKQKHNDKKARTKGKDDISIKMADTSVKSKILLKANVKGYKICYRRVKSTNELIVNGFVYDEKKGILEFTHKLCATIDGHEIEAGYNDDGFSYILFDGKLISQKARLI